MAVSKVENDEKEKKKNGTLKKFLTDNFPSDFCFIIINVLRISIEQLPNLLYDDV